MGLSIKIAGAAFDPGNTIAEILEPHRYWQIRINSNSSPGDGATISELKFREVPGGADVSAGAAKSASSAFNAGTVIDYAFDASTATNYVSAIPMPVPTTITLDFAATPRIIREIEMTPWDAAPNRAPATMDVRYSDDGIVFITSWSIVAGAWTAAAKVFTRP